MVLVLQDKVGQDGLNVVITFRPLHSIFETIINTKQFYNSMILLFIPKFKRR